MELATVVFLGKCGKHGTVSNLMEREYTQASLEQKGTEWCALPYEVLELSCGREGNKRYSSFLVGGREKRDTRAFLWERGEKETEKRE